jgi:hypothetical protein
MWPFRKKIIEIIARPKSGKDIRSEFDRFLELSRKEGWNELKVLFGFAWGNYVYEGDWIEEIISPDELQKRVKDAEMNGDGSISNDDLYIKVLATGRDYTFCHENDIHISGAVGDAHILEEAERFKSLGWEIYENRK